MRGAVPASAVELIILEISSHGDGQAAAAATGVVVVMGPRPPSTGRCLDVGGGAKQLIPRQHHRQLRVLPSTTKPKQAPTPAAFAVSAASISPRSAFAPTPLPLPPDTGSCLSSMAPAAAPLPWAWLLCVGCRTAARPL